MTTEPVDTDGVLDRCARCGARARFVIRELAYTVECPECGNAIESQWWQSAAMTKWNQEQREARSCGDRGKGGRSSEMDNESTARIAVVPALLAGERVTWTHSCQRGRSIIYSVREGRVAANQDGDTVRVKYRGEVINMRRDRVRRIAERNELTDMVMGTVNASPTGGRQEARSCGGG